LKEKLKKKGFFNVRNHQIPYSLTTEKVNKNDYAELILKWEDPFLKVSSLKIIKNPPPGFEEPKGGWNSQMKDMKDMEEKISKQLDYLQINQINNYTNTTNTTNTTNNTTNTQESNCQAYILLTELYPNCPSYIDEIVNKLGVDSLEDFQLIRDQEWEKAGVKLIHRRKIIQAAEKKLTELISKKITNLPPGYTQDSYEINNKNETTDVEFEIWK